MAKTEDSASHAISFLTLFRRAATGLRRDQRGATAVEFALIALPFFALLFAILETALIFLMGQILETATENSARLIRTGQAQQAAFDRDDFRDSICEEAAVLLNCTTKLVLDVRTADDFGSVDLSTPVAEGVLNDDDFGYDDGSGQQIVVVRAFYEWPTVTQFLGSGFIKLANGNHLLASTAAFRNEPFPW